MTRAHAIIRLERVRGCLDHCLEQLQGDGYLRSTAVADLAVARYDIGELIPELGELLRRDHARRLATSAGTVGVRR